MELPPGDDLDDAIAPSALLDRLCAEIGRDSDVITRSLVLPVSYDQPRATRAAVAAAVAAGFGHIVLALPAPYHRRRTVGHRQDHHHTPPLSA